MTIPADSHGPPPEWLAGFADDELDPAAARRVRDWLATHPALTEELSAQIRFSPSNRRLWQAVEPSQPSEQTWGQLGDQIREAVASAQTRHLPRRSGPWWPALIGVGLAASVALAVLLPLRPVGGPLTTSRDDDAWIVAETRDVEIISLRTDDAPLLVVGEPPMAGPIVLATAEDVEVHTMTPWQGMQPEVPPMKGSDVPMVVAVPQGQRP